MQSKAADVRRSAGASVPRNVERAEHSSPPGHSALGDPDRGRRATSARGFTLQAPGDRAKNTDRPVFEKHTQTLRCICEDVYVDSSARGDVQVYLGRKDKVFPKQFSGERNPCPFMTCRTSKIVVELRRRGGGSGVTAGDLRERVGAGAGAGV
jgi:hypothetical protein